MANFFYHFPKTVYSKGDNSSVDILTNLTVNFTVLSDILNNSAMYYEYTIADGDTPEIVAHKIYGYSDYHWIILKINNIIDIKTDWPIEYSSLNESINVAYSTSEYADTANTSVSGLQWAKTNTRSYYKVVTKTIVGSELIEVDEFEIDSNAYTNLIAQTTPTLYTLPNNDVLSVLITKDTMTYYEYEIEQNENKRNIKILKSEFVGPLIEEFKRVMSDG